MPLIQIDYEYPDRRWPAGVVVAEVVAEACDALARVVNSEAACRRHPGRTLGLSYTPIAMWAVADLQTQQATLEIGSRRGSLNFAVGGSRTPVARLVLVGSRLGCLPVDILGVCGLGTPRTALGHGGVGCRDGALARGLATADAFVSADAPGGEAASVNGCASGARWCLRRYSSEEEGSSCVCMNAPTRE